MTRLQLAVLQHLAARGEMSRQGLCQATGRRVTNSTLDILCTEDLVSRVTISWNWYSVTAQGREVVAAERDRQLLKAM